MAIRSVRMDPLCSNRRPTAADAENRGPDPHSGLEPAAPKRKRSLLRRGAHVPPHLPPQTGSAAPAAHVAQPSGRGQGRRGSLEPAGGGRGGQSAPQRAATDAARDQQQTRSGPLFAAVPTGIPRAALSRSQTRRHAPKVTECVSFRGDGADDGSSALAAAGSVEQRSTWILSHPATSMAAE